MIKNLSLILLIFSISFACNARDQIRVVGSSTLYPFVTIVAEQYGKRNNVKTPIVEATGTGGGINIFCSGNDLIFPDIVAASRKIKEGELKRCKEKGVSDVKEVLIGYDGIVIASAIHSPDYNFTVKDIFNAIASNVPKNGILVPNFHNNWNEINQSLPNNIIEIYGPTFTSGTRETLVELALVKYCMDIPEFIETYPEIKERDIACRQVRRDGKFIDMGENDNLIVHKIQSNTTSLGIIGYSFLLENKHAVKAAKINNIETNIQNNLSQKYPLSRGLYLYINQDHEEKVTGLNEFIAEFKNPRCTGKYGYLTLKGFISS